MLLLIASCKSESGISINDLSGQQVSGIISYNATPEKQVEITRDIIFPQLRKFTRSDESVYRAYLREQYKDNILPVIISDQRKFEPGILDSICINGKISFYFGERNGLRLVRTFFPSMKQRVFIEKWSLTNTGDTAKNLRIGATDFLQHETGWNGEYRRKIFNNSSSSVSISPGQEYQFAIYYTATLNNESLTNVSWQETEHERNKFLDTISRNLVLSTPDKTINTLFYFSKIRAAESIFLSKEGLVHSPGGGNYYVGIWANDQLEYSGPFFSYLGYHNGMTAAMNAYRIFQNNIPKDNGKIWASFEMNVNFPFGEYDRGDAAMIAYGATHFLLASGDQKKATTLWPLIAWCLDYCKKRLTPEGIVTSESDELEGRFPAGTANLSTSSLYYGALIQAARLAGSMNMPKTVVADFEARAKTLSGNIERYFGADMNGLKTYKYYKENTTLRSWICLPLVVGLNERKNGRLDALFNYLWSANGVLTEGGKKNSAPQVFWDRGTLYAFRGAFKAGETNKSLNRLLSYSQTRLTGFRVPYAVEAWPENSMAHLSAESALYCRIFTEGVLGLEPTGFNTFTLEPHLPDKWDNVAIKQIKSFGSSFDIKVARVKDKTRITVVQEGKLLLNKVVNAGEKVQVSLH
ncbi:six-hairpin glycosidase-like protein [Mucilaginibacter limnophilus]|uniref:Six-hairpin glycosidase-like protein n=1 Tax=Mucilaginibacter limnophilus TaxID=1932778 RepID=A0A3S2UJ01_9SPHI|nr:six-hairpin glycosidase-like protein [Mucilaginibacter limnophilus]RVT97365.1 six-hairpin glycosidase-like protein [Mucilaginibacter limnophilus]